MRRKRGGATLAALAGAAVGAAGVVVLATTGGPSPPPKTASAGSFLAAWQRSLTATYVVTWRFERVFVDGRRFSATLRRVQRPPDRLEVSTASLSGRLHGRLVGCLVDERGAFACRDGGPAPPYRAEVAREMGLLGRLVNGPTATYSVRPEEDCFVLVLRARLAAPPYGEDARFCFDLATGALARAVVHRAAATDTHVATELRTEVHDADLAVPGVGAE